MSKKTSALLLGICLTLSLAGCSVSHETTSTSTVSKNVNGETTTTTTTTTTENGVTTEETIITEESDDAEEAAEAEGAAEEAAAEEAGEAVVDEDDPTGLRADWHDLFLYGAEGQNEAGENYYLAYDGDETTPHAAFMLTNPDSTILGIYELGEIITEEDGSTYIEDVEGEDIVPFEIIEDSEDGFVIQFDDGEAIEMFYVDQETIIDDMISIWEAVQTGEIAY